MTATPPPKPLAQRPVLWVSIAAGLVLAVGAVALGYAVAGASASGAAGDGVDTAAQEAVRPEPGVAVPAVPLPAPSEQASTLPTDCAEIYTRDWAAELGPLLVLNPSWTDDADSGVRSGTNDIGLETVLEATTSVTCVWAKESGGGDTGLTTNVAVLTPEQRESVLAVMAGRGDECYEELSGTRCVSEQNDDGASWGESHFLRDDVWIATRWVNSGPDGYTHDIVETLWP